jgi:tetratricopeptide (TPR) repeat protein
MYRRSRITLQEKPIAMTLPTRANDYSTAVAALCRVAHGQIDAARFDDAIGMLRGLLAALALPEVPITARAQLLLTLAEALLWHGSLIDTRSFPAANAAAEQALAAALSLGMPQTLASAALLRVRVAYHRFTQTGFGDLAAIEADLVETQRWAADVPEIADVAQFTAGLLAERAKQFEQATALFQATLADAVARNDERLRAEALRHLGFAALRAAHYEEATASFAEALRIVQASGPGYALPFAHLALGEANAAQGQIDAARRQFKHGLALAETSGNRRAQMQIQASLAEILLADEPAAAAALLERAARAADLLDHAFGRAYIQQLRAQLATLSRH